MRVPLSTKSDSRRGVALLLVMVAVIVSSIVAYSYLAGQSTSIGIARNINTHAKARYIAETGLDLALAAIKADSNWRTTYANGTWVTHAPLLGGTVTVKGEDGQDSDGNGVITNPSEGDGDLADDPSDLLTLTITGNAGGSAHVLRTVVMSIPGATMVVYGQQGEPDVLYRTRSGSSWSSHNSANDVGNNPKWYVARYCPTRNEAAVCTLDNANNLHLQFHSSSTWTTPTLLQASALGIVNERPFDLAYEEMSGDLMVVYGAAGGGTLRYRTATGSGSLSAESTLTLPTSGNLRWIRLVPQPKFSDVLAITLDANRAIAAANWTGSAWGNIVQLTGPGKVSSYEQIAAAYDGLTPKGMVAWSVDGSNDFKYRVFQGNVWTVEKSGPNLPAEPQWLKLAGDPNSKEMVMASMDAAGRIILSNWTGSKWENATLTVETSPSVTDRRCFDVAYDATNSTAVAVWGRAGQSNFFYRTWTGAAWSAEVTGSGLSGQVSIAQLVPDPSQNAIHLTVSLQVSNALESLTWNGSSFSARVQMEANASGPGNTESFMVACPTSAPASGAAYTIDWTN